MNGSNSLTKVDPETGRVVSTEEDFLLARHALGSVRGAINDALITMFNPKTRTRCAKCGTLAAHGVKVCRRKSCKHDVMAEERWGILLKIWERLHETKEDGSLAHAPEDLCVVIAEHNTPLFKQPRVKDAEGNEVDVDGMPGRDADGIMLYPRFEARVITRTELIAELRVLNQKADLQQSMRRADLPEGSTRLPFDWVIFELKKIAFPPEEIKGEARNGIWIHLLCAIANNNWQLSAVMAVPPPRVVESADANTPPPELDGTLPPVDGVAL